MMPDQTGTGAHHPAGETETFPMQVTIEEPSPLISRTVEPLLPVKRMGTRPEGTG